MIALVSACAAASPADAAVARHLATLQQSQWSDWQVPDRARRELAKAGPAAIAPVLSSLDANSGRRFHHWARAVLYDVVHAAKGDAKAQAGAALARELANGQRSPRVRGLAAELLGRLGDPAQASALMAGLGQPGVRAPAARALGALGAKQAAPALRKLLAANLSIDERVGCLEALGRLADPSAVDAITGHLDHKDRQVRTAAIDALALMPGDNGLAALKRMTQSKDRRTATRAAVAMLRKGKALVAAGDIKALLAAGDRACQGCHAAVFADYERSAHRRKKKMACDACHGKSTKHMEDYGETKPDKPTGKKLMPEQCGVCHVEFEDYRECRYDPLGVLDHQFARSSFKRTRDLLAKLKSQGPPAGMDLLVEDDFESGKLSNWVAYPKSVWRVDDDQGGRALHLVRPFRGGGVGGPSTVALLRDFEVADFVLTARGRCTVRRGDINLIFGWRDPKHFYFVHYAPRTAPGYNMIAICNGRTRQPIHVETKPPARLKDSDYHVLRVERYADTGVIRAYIDDMETPAFTAVDKTFQSGLVGVGSFGDAGFFDDVWLHGRLARKRSVDLDRIKLFTAPAPAPKPAAKAPAPKPQPKATADLPVPPRLPLLFEDGFEPGHASAWKPTTGNDWRVSKLAGGLAYELTRPGKLIGKVRKPGGMSILKAPAVTDCVVVANTRCMQRPNRGGRDMCIFFGYQDPTHFYYVHFSNRSDRVHNAILKVDDRDRQPITIGKPIAARLTTQGWHLLKVERDVGTGAIRAYIDDMAEPIMTAQDRTFTWGLVGVGTFDDWGYFDDVKLYGLRHTGPERAILP